MATLSPPSRDGSDIEDDAWYSRIMKVPRHVVDSEVFKRRHKSQVTSEGFVLTATSHIQVEGLTTSSFFLYSYPCLAVHHCFKSWKDHLEGPDYLRSIGSPYSGWLILDLQNKPRSDHNIVIVKLKSMSKLKKRKTTTSVQDKRLGRGMYDRRFCPTANSSSLRPRQDLISWDM